MSLIDTDAALHAAGMDDDDNDPCCATPQAAAVNGCRCWGSSHGGRWMP